MDLSPRQIVAELDRYIIGQDDAKRAVAIALRNRYRRSCLPDELREEITPKNIIMKGPTGVGKTEIARRLARLVKAPFVKVEATKYTEVGYVGRDVESMIRDLAETAVRIVREERYKEVESIAREEAEKRIANIILKAVKKEKNETPDDILLAKIRDDIKSGKEDGRVLEMELAEEHKPIEIVPGSGAEINLGDMFGGLMPQKKKKRKLTVKEALIILIIEESEKRIDKESINTEALRRAENDGIIFIDEIDKIGASKGGSGGPDVSREGVQRDILPLIEGSTVMTKYGQMKTDYILFIASGAFHISKISDLIPELQGRFPISVELKSLKREDFKRILTEPENAVTRQYASLLAVDKVNLEFKEDAIDELAGIAETENETSENIGARRLHTVIEALLEDISYNASGDYEPVNIIIDRAYVQKNLNKTIKQHDLKKFIL